jgi:hypothetical protein
MSESPNPRWFDNDYNRKCSCGKRADGNLRGSRNESYGPHCKACANKRLKASERVRKENLEKMVSQFRGEGE